MDNATLSQQLAAEFAVITQRHDCMNHLQVPMAAGLSALLVSPDQGWRVVAIQLLPYLNSVLQSRKLTRQLQGCYAVLNSSMNNLEFYKGVIRWVFPVLIEHYSSMNTTKV